MQRYHSFIHRWRRRWVAVLTTLVILSVGMPQVAPVFAIAGDTAPVPHVQQAVSRVGVAQPENAQSHQQSGVHFEPGPCTFDVATSLQDGKDLQCGWLTVPEQYATPNGPTIQLGVAILKSKSPNPAPDPIVMLQGGPGGSTIETYLQLFSIDTRLRDTTRDIILFDQRGTQYTKPNLFCQEVYDLTIRTLNVDMSKDEANRQIQDALKSCHDRLVSQGVNLSAFDSLENAADVDALRQALGYEKINLYGVSYGTLLALHVLRQYPQGLRSVTLDSVVPPQTNFIVDAPLSFNRSLEEVFTGCAGEPRCDKAYPNLKDVFYQQVDRLNAQKVPIQLTDTKTGQVYPTLLDGDTLINAVVQMLYITDLVPQVPRVIYEVRARNYTFLQHILSLIVFDHSMSLGMYYSVLCAEDANFDPQSINLDSLPKPLADSQKDGAAQFLQTCSYWKVQPLEAIANQAVQSDVPTLVLSGQFDPITPPTYAKTAAQTLTNSYFFLFPVGGHGELTSGECQDSIFLQFIDQPGKKPDGSCIVQQKMAFSAPGDLVRLPSVFGILTLQGAYAVEAIVYVLGLLILLTALGIYPLVWLVRVLRGKRPAAVVDPAFARASAAETGTLTAVPPPPTRGLYRFAPWLVSLTAVLLTGFSVVAFVIMLRMAVSNDNRILLGLPGVTRPLFLLPWFAAMLIVGMLIAAVRAWGRRLGSVMGRLYFSLLILAGVLCVVVLNLWGMYAGLFAG